MDFTPLTIGNFDTKKFTTIRENYSLLCDDLTLLYSQLSNIFDGFTVDDLFEFINDTNPERWLTRKYAISQEEFYPGMNLPALIGTGILQLPFEFSESLADYDRIKITLNKIKGYHFFYPLVKLFLQTESENFFAVTDEFRSELEKQITPKTQSIAQNTAVEGLQQIMDGLNVLHQLKILNFQTHGTNFLGLISDFFVIDKSEKNAPVAIDRNLFIKTKMRRFMIKSSNSNNSQWREYNNLWKS